MLEVQTHSVLADVQSRVGEVVIGQEVALERLLIAMLTGGHVLLQGMPGVAKTLLANSLARALDLRFARVQFTIDLLPADIVGCEIFRQGDGRFETSKGPIFTNFLLADEINRAAPKVQSALLEAMQERRVTIGGQGYDLPVPFLVVATQNPVEMSGTFELPEAQLDRFMFCHRMGYPSQAVEEQVINNALRLGLRHDEDGSIPMTAFDQLRGREPVATRADLRTMMEGVKAVRVSPVLIKHSVDLVQLTRQSPDLEVACSPRASIALVEGARARAFLMNRDYAIPDDLFELAEDTMLHRLRPTHAALAEGKCAETILQDIMRRFMASAETA